MAMLGIQAATERSAAGPARRFLQVFVPIAALIVLAAALVAYEDGREHRELLLQRTATTLAYAVDVPALRLQGPVDALRALTDQLAMVELLDDANATAVARMTSQFASLIEGAERYAQIRWIDEGGRERIRVDRRDGRAVVAEPAALQDKSDRYYFREAARLPPRALYVSPIDLNVEHGVIEQPLNPMIRLATPVFDRGGRPRGIVIINVRATNLIERIRRTLADLPGEPQLLDGDGFWIDHPDPERRWGFMLNQGVRLGSLDPQAWAAIRAAPQGQVALASGVWTWARSRIGAEIGQWGAQVGEQQFVNMIVAVRLPASDLGALWRVNLQLIGGTAALFLLLSALLSWRLVVNARAREAQEARAAALRAEAEAERELRRSESRRGEAEQALREEQARAREAAERSTREWRRLAESMPQLVWTCDGDGQCDYLSQQWLDYTGIAEAPQLGSGWLQQVHPEDQAPLQAAWGKAVATLGVFDVEFRIRRFDGVYRWFKTRAVPVVDEGGRIRKWFGSNTDIDDLKRASRALEDSERRFRTIYDTTPVSIWEEDWSGVIHRIGELRAKGVTDIGAYCRAHPDCVTEMLRQVRILDVNQRTLELFRAPDKATMLASLETVFATADTLPGFVAEVCALAAGQTLFTTEMAVNTVDRRELRVLLSMAFPAPGSGSGIVFVSVIDITEKRRIADELELHRHHLEELVQRRTRELHDANTALARMRDSLLDSETRFRSAFESAAIGMALVGLDGRFAQVNPALCDLLGYTESELCSLTFQQITHPDDLNADLALVQELADGKRRSYQLEKRYLRKDGSIVWIMLTGSTVENAAGQVRYFIAQIQDITDSKRAKDALQDREKFLRTITDALPGMVGYWDADLRCRFANAAYLSWFGLAPEGVIGIDMRELLGPDLFAANERYIRAALAGEPQRFERALVRADGSTGHTWAHYIPDVDGGRVRGFFVLVTDVTELKQAQIALQRANTELVERTRQAESASEAKSRFLATMSHEIRTPMNAVLGLVQLLSETPLEPRQSDYVRKVHSASKALLKILNDILDYSKMEAGRMALESVDFTLDSVLEGVGDLFAVSAESKGLELFVRVGADVPQRLKGDPLRLGQILNNLVGNAIKFTERGEVRIVVECERCADQIARLRFRVEDTGMGMSPQQREQLFHPFVQGDSSTTRRFGGTGLGLTICRRLVEMMHGDIEAHSELGGGTRVSFTVQLEKMPAAGEPRPGAGQRGQRGLRVLVVDDRPTSHDILESMMTAWGMVVTRADSHQAAMAALGAAAGERRAFDVVLVDGDLRAADGQRLASLLRSSDAAGAWPPERVVMMSADTGPDDSGERLPDGVDALLTKPVTPSRLLDVLAGFLGRARMSPVTGREASVRECRKGLAALAGARILVAEDNLINQQVARELLTQLGFEVDVVENGAQALERVEAAAYQLVLMDLQMPIMDGYEATRRIRALPRHAALPIVAMTASAMAEDRAATRKAGMNDHLSKPIDLASLTAALARWIPPGDYHAQPNEESADPRADAQADPDAPLPSLVGIDTASALARLAHNRALYLRLLRQFAAQARETVPQLRALLGRDERASAARLLHSLKGTAATIGAGSVAACAAELEAALQGADAVDVEPLQAALDAVLHGLESLPKPQTTPTADVSAREQIDRIRELVRGHRPVSSADIDGLLHAMSGHSLADDGRRLAHALEEFDYVAAARHLDRLRERLS